MPQQVVIVGAVALGPKAACRFKRCEPDSRVLMVDEGDLISYGGCGIPYYVSGDVADAGALQSTSFHMLRDARFFRDAKDIEVRTRTRAVAIDREGHLLHVVDQTNGREETIPYDRLVLATGSRPVRLPVPGAHLPGVTTVSNLDEGVAIKEEIAAGKVGRAVVIGAGAIGLEMAEALSDLWGIETCVVEIQDQVLPGVIGSCMAGMVRRHLEERGVRLCLSERVLRIEGEGRAEAVVTDRQRLEADLVIMACGVRPNSELGRAAGLEIGPSGALRVNTRLQTSDPLIYAGGDCVEVPHLVTGKPGYFPSGSLANRQGRVIGTNLAGGDARFEGAVGSFVIKVFDLCVASAGLSLTRAKAEGFEAFGAFVVQFDRSHFYPEKDLLYLELVVESPTGRVLGIQGLGPKNEGVLARVAAVAALLRHRPTVTDVGNLELPYAPPFSSAMDVLNALGNTAENILQGRNRVLEPEDFGRWWAERKADGPFFLDCRGWGNAEPYVRRYPDDWKSIPQDELRRRLQEVPRDRPVVLICNTGVRSYEAQITLRQMGIDDTYNLQGGMAAVKKLGLDI